MKKIYQNITFLFVLVVMICSCGNKQEERKIINSLDDITDEKVCVSLGSTQDQFLKKNNPKIPLFQIDDCANIVPALTSGQVDIALIEESAAKEIVNKNPDFVIVGDPVFAVHIGLAFADTSLRDEFNQFLAEKKSSGALEALSKKWEDHLETAEMVNFENSGKNGKLIVGCNLMVPYTAIRENKFVGFEPELISEFAAIKQMNVEFQAPSFASLIAGINSKKMDIICGCISITEERKQNMIFSEPIDETQSILVVRKTLTKSEPSTDNSVIRSIDDLKGKKVAVTLGTTHDQFLEKNYPEVIIKRLDSEADVILAVSSGEIEVGFLNGAIAKAAVKTNPALSVVDNPVYSEDFGFGFHDSHLRDEFNVFLNQKKLSGALEKLVEKWETDSDNAVMPVFDNHGENGTLDICGYPGVPFLFSRNNKYVGIEMELLEEFAAIQKKKVDLKITNFASIMANLASKKADIISGTITITEERAKTIKFSTPYYTSQALLLIKKPQTPTQNTPASKAIHSLDDLKGKKVAVTIGGTQDLFLTQNYPDIMPFRFDSYNDVVPSLLNGTIQGALMDGALAKVLVKEQPDFIILPEPAFTEDFGIPFSKTDLRDEFNTFLSEKKQSGSLQTMIEKWEELCETAEMPPFKSTGEGGTLTIAVMHCMPFAFIRDNNYCGLEVELLQEFAARKNMDVKYFDGTYGTIVPLLTTQKADVAIGGITITEERAQKVYFSDVHYLSQSSVVVKKETSGNRRIGVLLGSSQDLFATDYYRNDEIKHYENYSDLLTALQHRDCEAVVLDDVVIKSITKELPHIVCLEENLYNATFHIVAPKNSQTLIDEVNVFLKELKASGELDAIIQRWEDNPNATMPKIENSGQNGTLTIASQGTVPPFSMIDNDEPCGIEIELISRFAAKIGKTPKIELFSFTGLLSAITTNKVDIAISAIMRTDERAEQMCFSDPYCMVKSNLYGMTVAEESDFGWWTSIKESFYNNLIKEQRYMLIFEGLKATIIISLLSVLFGTLLGGIVCFAKMSKNKVLKITASLYIDLLRGIPQVVLLMIMFYVVFASSKIDGLWVASITFAMNFAAYVSEMFRTSIESVDKGQTEAGIAMGFNKIKTFLLIVAPQAVKRVMPVYRGETISLVKMTSIVGYIAVQDLTKAGDIIRSRTFDAFFPLIFIAIIYFILSWFFGWMISQMAKKLNK